MSDVSVTIHGCRGSYPVSGPQFNRHGGATSCVVVRVGEQEIIFDAGTGIIGYGRELLARDLAAKDRLHRSIFFSHLHFDHLNGLPYFPPVFHPRAKIHLFGPRPPGFPSLEEAIACLVRSPYFPVELHEMHAEKCFRDFTEVDVAYFVRGQDVPVVVRHFDSRDQEAPPPEEVEAEVHCLRGFSHPKSGVSFYKVIGGGKTVVYATDTEGYVHGDQRLAAFSAGADLLIHDAMYTEAHYASMPVPTQGYGHSTVQIACELATLANVQQLCLFHHDPSSTDEHLDAVGRRGKEFFANTVVAQDGMTFSL